MKNTIEVVFEDVPANYVPQLLRLLINSSMLAAEFHSQDIELLNQTGLSDQALKEFMKREDSSCALLKLQELHIGDVILPNVQLRLVKYDDHYDIDFNFDMNELENTTANCLINELYTHSNKLAEKHNVPSVFSGMEPASDEDTRYFTNKNIGPLKV